MPTDVSMDIAAHASVRPATTRLPIGLGLTIGALASVALWAGIGMSLHALLA
jgi:type VI protein secretion system component VasF